LKKAREKAETRNTEAKVSLAREDSSKEKPEVAKKPNSKLPITPSVLYHNIRINLNHSIRKLFTDLLIN